MNVVRNTKQRPLPKTRLFVLATIASGWIIPGSAMAATETPDRSPDMGLINVDPPADVSVLDRKRPDFDPDGVALGGGYILYPSFSSSANVTDNVYKQPNGRSDVYTNNTAKFSLTSDPTTLEVTADGQISQTNYARFTKNDVLTYVARAGARFALSDMIIVRASGLREKVALDRAGVGETVNFEKPTRYDRTDFKTAAQLTLDKFRVTAAFDYDDVKYLANRDQSGGLVEQNTRNYKLYRKTLRLGWSPSRITEFYVEGVSERRTFTVPAALDRDVTINSAVAGVEGDITPLIHGRIAAGVLGLNFDAPTIGDETDFTFDLELNFYVSKLTTVSLTGERRLANVANAASSAALRTSVGLRADHELYRNLVISLEGRYVRADYINTAFKAEGFSLTSEVSWMISKRIRVNFAAAETTRNGRNFSIDRDFSSFVATAGVTLSF